MVEKNPNQSGSLLNGVGIVITLSLMGLAFFAGYKAGSFKMPDIKAMVSEQMNVTPTVATAQAVKSFIDNPSEYVGLVEAIESVDLRAQVGGYIQKVHFTEGKLVNKGDLLVSIDQRQYQATLDLRKAQLAQAQSDLAQAEKYLSRLTAADGRSVSQNEIDSAQSTVQSGKAMVQQAAASVALAQLDMDRTEVKAPVSGYIGQALVTEGNYIDAGKDTLARIVQVDPVRVVFSMSDRQYLDYLGKVKSPADSGVYKVKLRTPDGKEFAADGVSDFLDNQFDPATASVAIRFRFTNPERVLLPGGYVTVVLDDTTRPQAIIVPHSAVMQSAEGASVYVVDEGKKAQLRPVTLGVQTETGIVIESGLNEGDKFIVQGLQKVMPGGDVKLLSDEQDKGTSDVSPEAPAEAEEKVQ